jgi:hypothetical protein
MLQLHYKNTKYNFAAMFVQCANHTVFNTETLYVYLKFHVFNTQLSHCGIH